VAGDILRGSADGLAACGLEANPRRASALMGGGFWPPKILEPWSLFAWCHRDALVAISFGRHFEKAPPSAVQLELNREHVSQLSVPSDSWGVLEFPRRPGGLRSRRRRRSPVAEVPTAEVPEVAADRVLGSP
jgi:hypothetical protein